VDANPLSLAAQVRALVPAVAAYKAACAETVTERRARGTGRPRAIDVGKSVRERIVEFVARVGQARVKDIAAEFGMRPGRTSHHITRLLTEKRLQRCGGSLDGYEIRKAKHA